MKKGLNNNPDIHSSNKYKPTPKQLAWRQRVNLLWRIKGIYIPIKGTPLTLIEREKLLQADKLIKEVIHDFTDNSVSLGFNAVARCYFCGKPATYIKEGLYLCEEHQDDL